MEAKSSQFKTPPFGNRTDRPLEKVPLFLDAFFLWMGWTTHIQIWHKPRGTLYLSTDTKKAWFAWMTCHFDTTPISRFYETFSIDDCIQHKSTCFWVSFNKCALHRCACKIWRCAVYLSHEKHSIFSDPPYMSVNVMALKCSSMLTLICWGSTTNWSSGTRSCPYTPPTMCAYAL
jgi:hypothetical protein